MIGIPKKEPLRILHVVGGMNRGGTETWLMHVLRNVDRERYQMDFLVHSDQPGAYDDDVRSLGARIIPCLSPGRPWQYAVNFYRVLRDYGPYHVVHSHVNHFSGLVLWLAKQANIPVRIAHSHSDTSTLQSTAGPLRRTYLRLAKALIHRCSTDGVAASELAAASLFGDSWRSEPRWRLLFCAVDVEQFTAAVDRTGVRSELGLPLDARLIGHVGRFVPVKNHSYAVDIAAELVRCDPRAYVVFVGDGPLRESIERKVESMGLREKVVFAGLRSDVPRVMMAMDALILPSHFEGLPLVLIEAQAAGLPCYISDVVAKEADIVPELVDRLSISLPPAKWAAEILETKTFNSREDAYARVKSSPFNIENGVTNLTRIYTDGIQRTRS